MSDPTLWLIRWTVIVGGVLLLDWILDRNGIPGDTLSESVRFVIRWCRPLAVAVWVVLLSWLTVHFFAPELLRLHP